MKSCSKKLFPQPGLLKGLANDDIWRGNLLLESDQWCSVLVVILQEHINKVSNECWCSVFREGPKWIHHLYDIEGCFHSPYESLLVLLLSSFLPPHLFLTHSPSTFLPLSLHLSPTLPPPFSHSPSTFSPLTAKSHIK